MTVNFALSLSYAGIDLLQRAEDGWRKVGTASLMSANLAADLAHLRETGASLATDGFFTKVVIPSDQIKFLTIANTQTTRADLYAALDGATPYRPDELAIDFERGDSCTYIAAVARETLKEAEDFAYAHGFNPVCFVATPDPDTFRQEIFFGPTSRAAAILGPHGSVARDSLPVPPTGPITTPLQADKPAAVLRPLPYLDRVISEYHRPVSQTEVPLIAVPLAGAPRPLVLGGVVEPVTPLAMRAPFVMPAAIAASVALLSVFLWAHYTPDIDRAMAAAPAADLVDIVVATPQLPDTTPTLPVGDDAVAIAAAPAALVSDTADTASIDAPPAPIGQVLTPDQAMAAYAATGVWQRPPRFADVPSDVATDSIDWPVSIAAPARMVLPVLPLVQDLTTDGSFLALADPPAADAVFDLDEDGFVRATAEGALTPEGTIVYAGLPDLPFMARPDRVPEVADEQEPAETETVLDEPAPQADVATADGVPVIEGRPPVVPPARPRTIGTDDDPAVVAAGGVPLTGLLGTSADAADTPAAVASLLTPPTGAIRPQLRPALPQAATNQAEVEAVLGGIAFVAPDPLAGASALAVARSVRPALRPANFDTRAAAARSSQEPAAAPAPAPTAVAAAPVAPPAPPPAPAPAPVAAAPVAPQNYAPVPGGVARAATQENAIRLRDMNLIGVYGQANARRALVRLGNGQYVRVQVGSELDGGQVTAIGENALNFVRRGTTYALQIPSG